MSQVYHTAQQFYIKPRYIVSIPELSGLNGTRSTAQRSSEVNLKDNNHKGILSPKAKKRLNNSTNWLIDSSKHKRVFVKSTGKYFWFKVNFITLTVPLQNNTTTDHKSISRAFHNWLVYVQKYFYVRNYVWKLEFTEKGQIHYHLLTDTFIHYKKIRRAWNRSLIHNNCLTKEFIEQHGDDFPSTDVHAVRNLNDVGAYVAKYMSKSIPQDVKFTGRIWGCNYEISDASKCKCVIDYNELAAESVYLMHRKIRWKSIRSICKLGGEGKKIGELYFINQGDWNNIIKGKIADAYNNHRYSIRNNYLPPPLEFMEVEYLKEKSTTNINRNEKQTQIPGKLDRRNQTENITTRQLQMYELWN